MQWNEDSDGFNIAFKKRHGDFPVLTGWVFIPSVPPLVRFGNQMMTKRCSKCQQVKPLTAFSVDDRLRDGRGSWCKACRNAHGRAYRKAYGNEIRAKSRAWHLENRERDREESRQWRRTNRAKALLIAAKARARRRGLPFRLAESDIEIPTCCPVFGIRLTAGDSLPGPASPSIDRIVPAKGYVVGNILIVSWKANRMKGDADLKDLKRLVDFYDKRRKEAAQI